MPDHFQRLGLSRRFSIDADELERVYLAKSRDFHPDFHGHGSPAAQQESLQATAAINESYLILKDPFRRAEYLIELYGGPSAQTLKELPQVFLMEMMDLREEIDNAQRSQSTSKLEQLRRDLMLRFDELMKSVGEQFGDGSREPSAEELRQIRKEMNAAKVIRGLLRDLNDIG